MLKKVGIFLGIKYEPLSDPPVIKICEWGPWAENTVFMCEQRPIRYDFHVGITAIWYYNSHPKHNCRPHLCKILGGKQGVLWEFCKWQIKNKRLLRVYLSLIEQSVFNNVAIIYAYLLEQKKAFTLDKNRVQLLHDLFARLATPTWPRLRGFETPI